MYLELNEVNSSLAALLGPLVLGGAASGYLAASGTGGAAAGGVLALLDRAKDVVLANAQAAAAVGAAAGVAGVATIAVVLASGGTQSPTASPHRPALTGPLSQAPATTSAPQPRKAKKRTVAERTTKAPVAVTSAPSAASTAQAAGSPPDEEPKADKPQAQKPRDQKPRDQKPGPAPSTPKVTAAVLPPAPVADVAVRLTFSLRAGAVTKESDGLLGYLTATVTGVPAGQRSTLTVRVTGGRLAQRGGGCRASGSVATCEVGPGAAPLEFNVIGVPVSASATVTVPGGYTDPSRANNTDNVLLGVARLGSLRQ
jgi:hypothetical protein